MNKKSNAKKLAFDLYMSTELSQLAIAKTVGVRSSTVGKWVNDERWNEIKAADSVTRKRNIMNYQMQLAELNRLISSRDEGRRIPDSKEADIIKKLTAAIKDLDRSIHLTDYITVFEEFMRYLTPANTVLARQLIDYHTEFIQTKAKELSQQ